MPDRNDVWPAVSAWVQQRRADGFSANDVMDSLGLHLFAADQDEEMQWTLAAITVAQCCMHMVPRKPLLVGGNRLRQAIDHLGSCSRAIVITGADASNGVAGLNTYWASLDERARGGLSFASAMFDSRLFMNAPVPLLGYVSNIISGDRTPSTAHRFIRKLEQRSKLLRNYSQNIDGIEADAGIERVMHVHGCVRSATCAACRLSVPGIWRVQLHRLNLPSKRHESMA